MSDSNRDASSSAQQDTSTSGNTTPKGSLPAPSNNMGGESTFAGNVLRGSYGRPGCALKDEQVKIKLDDGRSVERGRAAYDWLLAG